MRTFLRDRAFRPGLLPTLAMLPLLGLLLWLGHWQWTRAGEKQALLDTWAARSLAPPVPLPRAAAVLPRYLRVAATGRYANGHQVLLDNQTHGGQAGYRVLTPLLMTDGTVVMVERGWVALPGNAREQLPDVAVGGELRTVVGRLEPFRQAGLSMASPPPNPVRDGAPVVMNYPSAAAVATAIGRPVYPAVLRLHTGAEDALLVEHGPALEFGPERHLGYAIQWWALALTLVLLWGWTALKPRRGTPKP